MSETNDFRDDPRLTAYALGELDEKDRAEIEALVAKNEAARRAVEEIRATATLVAAEVSAAGGAALTAEQRAKIAATARGPLPVLRTGRIFRINRTASVAAAVVIVASAAAIVGMLYDREAKQSARLNERHRADKPTPVHLVQDFSGETYSATASPEIIDRNAVPKSSPGDAYGPVNPNDVTIPDAKPGRAGELTDATEPGCFNPDPEAPSNLPSGATGGTSIGVGKIGHFGAGKPNADARRRGGGGRGGGGLGAPPATKSKGTDGFSKFEDPNADSSTATYAHVEDNPFRLVKDAPLSTFGADVDTASYANVRRFLSSGQLPPPGAVRIEEMINYFPYDYAPPTDGRPFSVRVDVAGCPWKSDHRLVKIGIKGKVVDQRARPAANLVFLLDVSGSMQPANRLPLIIQSMKLLVEKLEPRDRVAIVVYAGESGLALPSTSCEEKAKIVAALDALHSGGSTNGAAGIGLAYDIAAQNKIDGGVNRVILATDGDFNVGVSDESSLVKLIEEKRAGGVFLSVLGVGEGNYKDAQMEKLADHGNGNFSYIDTIKEGQKVLVEQAQGTLVTIAKDYKLQVEFNPSQVGAWRLIGYENRVLAAEDFKDDRKDAGDIGAGHTVTALYEVVPPGVLTQTAGVEPLKYQSPPVPTGSSSHELLTVKLRWKAPNSDVSEPMEVPVIDEGVSYSAASPDFKFAASVAAFGMCLRGSPYKGDLTPAGIVELATEGLGYDPGNYRKQFVELVSAAMKLGAK